MTPLLAWVGGLILSIAVNLVIIHLFGWVGLFVFAAAVTGVVFFPWGRST